MSVSSTAIQGKFTGKTLSRSIRLGLAILSLWVVCLGAASAQAQVNVESLRQSVASSGVGGKLNLSVASYRGNTDGTELGASGLVGGSWGRHMAYINASGRYSKFGGNVGVARSFGHARYNFALLPWLAVEALAQLERDRSTKIKLRTLLGTGLRSRLANSENFSAYAGMAYLGEYNRLLQQLVAVRPSTVHRLGTYLTAVASMPGAGGSLSSTLYFQPRLGRWSDVRLLWESSLSFDFAPHLSAGFHAKYRYETPVIAEVQSNDLTLTNTLGLKW